MNKVDKQYAAVLGSLGLGMAISLLALPAQADDACQLPKKGIVEGKYSLSQNCVYNGTIVIKSSDTVLDCKGATLDGQGQTKFGIVVRSYGQKLENVVVKNCVVKNYSRTGVVVTSGLKPNQWGDDRQANYAASPTNVTLERLQVENSGRVGVYFDDYVTDSVLRASTVVGSGGAGIYLDQATQRIKIVDNVIKDNGFSRNTKNGREGLAIDASAQNKVVGNKFIANAAGGVFLYKNCGEKISSGQSTMRWQSSNDNVISKNSFTDEKVGIWVASRQSRDLSKWDCGDQPVDAARRFYRDYANHNTIEDNAFCRNKVPVKIEGDNNNVKNNRFDTTQEVMMPFALANKPDGTRSVGNVITGGVVSNSCD